MSASEWCCLLAYILLEGEFVRLLLAVRDDVFFFFIVVSVESDNTKETHNDDLQESGVITARENL